MVAPNPLAARRLTNSSSLSVAVPSSWEELVVSGAITNRFAISRPLLNRKGDQTTIDQTPIFLKPGASNGNRCNSIERLTYQIRYSTIIEFSSHLIGKFDRQTRRIDARQHPRGPAGSALICADFAAAALAQPTRLAIFRLLVKHEPSLSMTLSGPSVCNVGRRDLRIISSYRCRRARLEWVEAAVSHDRNGIGADLTTRPGGLVVRLSAR